MKYIETLTHHCVDVKEELVGIDNSVRFREGHWSVVSEWSVVVSRCLPVIHRPSMQLLPRQRITEISTFTLHLAAVSRYVRLSPGARLDRVFSVHFLELAIC